MSKLVTSRDQPRAGPRHSLQRLAAVAACLLVLSHSVTAADNAPCYWPSGSASSDSSCNSNGTFSGCCGIGFACLTNGLCMNAIDPYNVIRGGCTDKSWKSSDCPLVCMDKDKKDNINSSQALSQCSTSSRDQWYCISRDKEDQCDDEPVLFSGNTRTPLTVQHYLAKTSR